MSLPAVIARVPVLEAEVRRLVLLCQSVHDGILAGAPDSELLALLETAWTPPTTGEPTP